MNDDPLTAQAFWWLKAIATAGLVFGGLIFATKV